MENADGARLYFDYLDPLSYLMDEEVSAALDGSEPIEVEHIPLELRPPPEPLLDPAGRWWRERWEAAAALSVQRGGPPLEEPAILPWTRKAHELVAHAGAHGLGREAHGAVFRAVFERGWDVGRVDVLVEVARELGLDVTETKAVLDVDRYAEDVRTRHEAARRTVGREPPVLVRGDQMLRGFHNRDAVRTFLLPGSRS